MNKTLYNIVQWTWGLPQTLIGSAVYLAHKDKEHFDLSGAKVTVWDRGDGLSLGKFIFVPRMTEKASGDGIKTVVSKTLALHEYGHSLQSLILGPTYLLFVGIPSLLWARLPYFVNKRKKTGRSYYSPLFERTADKLGKNEKNMFT